MRVLALILAATLLVPAAAFAQSEEEIETARQHFRDGREAYQNGEYERAIELFTSANSTAPNIRLHLYIGQAHANLGELGPAIAQYEIYAASSEEAAAEVAPDLDALRLVAVDVAFFEVAADVDDAITVAEGSQPAPRSQRRYELGTNMRDVAVQIRSAPRGASVFIDDVEYGAVGTTPLDVRLFTGRHLIVVERQYFESQSEIVNVVVPDAGESIPTFRFELERRSVPASITSEPITATVTYISEDGERTRIDSGHWDGELPAGPGTFLLQAASGDRRIEATVDAGPDETFEAHLNLDEVDDDDDAAPSGPQIGTLIIETSIAGATVSVDGSYLGASPGEFSTDVRAGEHTVTISAPGFVPWRYTVDVDPNEEKTVVAPTYLEPESGPSRAPAYVLLGVGLATTGVGAYMLVDNSDEPTTGAIVAGVGSALFIGGVIWLAAGNSSSTQTAEIPRFAVSPREDGFMLNFGGNL